ncbi:MAG: tRNA (guanosine(37)-N1)-methyltransferase TrmD [Candidatus Margulisbacteria bacterium]|nr:tRNA (guanosine(37)-N1)-methyltransferase TrmD [Candidatus Margulisiibacteriota bacterium]
MQIDIITLFPEMFSGPFSESLLKKAQEKKLIQINVHQLRDYAHDKHKQVDDKPFGGGTGMVIKCEPVFEAVEKIKKDKNARIILTCPQGKTFTHKKAQELAKAKQLIFLCGHYEGFDERIREHLVTDEISIGDYVLTGGELPAMIMVDTIARFIPGVVKEMSSVEQDSFQQGQLDYPEYTRPAEFRGWKVPEELLSGDHKKIEQWRKKQAFKNTKTKRPDLLS